MLFFLVLLALQKKSGAKVMHDTPEHEVIDIRSELHHDATGVHKFHFEAFGKNFNSHLRVKNIVSPTYVEHQLHFDEGNQRYSHAEKQLDTNYSSCHFGGHLVDEDKEMMDGTMVAVSNCGQSHFEGMVVDKEGKWYGFGDLARGTPAHEIQSHYRRLTRADGKQPHLHAIYELDSLHSEWGCKQHEHEHHEHEQHEHDGHPYRSLLSHLSTAAHSARSLNDATEPLIIEMLIGNDKKRADDFKAQCDQTSDKKDYKNGGCPRVGFNSLAIVNAADEMYRTSNFDPPISIVVVGQVSFPTGDPYVAPTRTADGGVSVDDFLPKWNLWHSAEGQEYVDYVLPAHDNAQMFSGLDFEDQVKGYAGTSPFLSVWGSDPCKLSSFT